tara:strand:+ start:1188 stop:1703 length:516 start_codon:yes stop_codon:yes gene_type:complete
MKKKHSKRKAILRETIKVTTQNNRPVQVYSVGKFKNTARFSDTNNFDLYFFQDKINQDQHQTAEYLYGLALASNIKLSVASFLSNPIKISGSAASSNNAQEKSAQSKKALNKILTEVSKRCGNVAKSLLESVVVYNYSIRDWSLLNNKTREGKLQLLQTALDEVSKIREGR